MAKQSDKLVNSQICHYATLFLYKSNVEATLPLTPVLCLYVPDFIINTNKNKSFISFP